MPSLTAAEFLEADAATLAALAAEEGADLVIPEAFRADVTENLVVLRSHARLLSAALQGAPEGPEPGPFQP